MFSDKILIWDDFFKKRNSLSDGIFHTNIRNAVEKVQVPVHNKARLKLKP